MSTLVNRAGGQLVADQRVCRFGSHHQKLLVVHMPDQQIRCIAFIGGIDLSRGRRDSPDHHGDDDPVRIDPRYGRRPPWHDLQLEVCGPAVLDVDLTFQERWRTVPRATTATRCAPCGGASATSRAAWGCCSGGCRPRRWGPTVQVLRTYPARRRVIPFAPDGERRPPRADRPGAGWATGPACSPASCGCGCGASTWGRGQGDDADLLDPAGGFQAWQPTAAHLQAWYQGGRQGSRPPGRILARQAPLAPP